MQNPVITPRMERISGGQLYSVMVLFLMGTTWFFIPGSEMGRDAWIAALMGCFSGLLLLLIYLRLQSLFPGETLAQWLPRLCGPVIGYVLGVIYALYFLYISARNIRDLAELLRLSFLVRTPVLALTLLQSSLVAMTAYYGLEVAGRVKQVLWPFVLLMLSLVGVGFWMRRYWPHVFPLLEYGVFPVWHYSFPLITTVPYGELVVFLTYLAYVNGRPTKAAIAALLTGGGILAGIAFGAVLVIGPANLANSSLPFYSTVRGISFGDVVQRLDAVIVPLLAFCAYTKASTFMVGATYSFAHLMGARRPATFCFPMTLLAAGMATTMAVSWGQHLEIGLDVVPYALHIPLQFVVPLLLWLLAEVRSRFRPITRPPKPLRYDTLPGWTLIVTTVLSLLFWIPTFFPRFMEKSPFTEYLLRPIGRLIGEPLVRLLGGMPMNH